MDSGARRRGKTKERKAWGLVLMGGGARGFAHIGVLAVLEENGLVPDIITGTSMGAIIGGLYAAGLSPARLKEIACGLGLNDYFEKSAASRLFKNPKTFFEYLMLADYKNRLFNKVRLDKKDAVEAFLRKLAGDVRIESLPIKFACNAVDLVSGNDVLFDRGKLYRALRATMTVPILFAAARREGMVLVDGGVLNNAPVEAAVKAGADVTVLVDVHRPLRRIPPGRIRTMFQIVQRTLDVARAAANEEIARRADVVLRIPLDVDTFDFSKPGKIIRTGEEVAAAALPMLEKTLAGRPVSRAGLRPKAGTTSCPSPRHNAG